LALPNRLIVQFLSAIGRISSHNASRVRRASRDCAQQGAWQPAAANAPSVGLFREHVGDADYVLALVTPPSLADAQKGSLPREIVFVIDNSGSVESTRVQVETVYQQLRTAVTIN